MYDALLADTLAQAQEAVDRAQSRAGLAERSADLAVAQARAQIAAATGLPEAVAALHGAGADGLCSGCGLQAPCPTAQLVSGGLELGQAQAVARGQLSAYAADRVHAPATGGDLTGADLTGADLTGADLTGIDLTGIDLTDIDLTGGALDGLDELPLTPSERARQPRHFLSGFSLPRRAGRPPQPARSEQADRADGMSGRAPAVPRVDDLLGSSPGVGRFLDRLLGPPPD
jgi:hypothetical protein